MTVAALWDERKSKIVEGELLTEWTYRDFQQTQRMWQGVKDCAGEQSLSADESGEWNWPGKFSGRTVDDRFLGIDAEGRLGLHSLEQCRPPFPHSFRMPEVSQFGMRQRPQS